MSIYNKLIIVTAILAVAAIICVTQFMPEEPKVEATHTGIEVSKTEQYRVNLNTASVSELSRVGGLGEAKAEKVIEMREILDGGYFTVEEITKVDGISWDWLNEWQECLCVE